MKRIKRTRSALKILSSNRRVPLSQRVALRSAEIETAITAAVTLSVALISIFEPPSEEDYILGDLDDEE